VLQARRPAGRGAAHQQRLQQAAGARRPQVQAAGQVRGLLQEGRVRAAHHARVDNHVAALRARARGGAVTAGNAWTTGHAYRWRDGIEQARLLRCMRRPKGIAAFHTHSSEVLGAGVVPAGSPPKAPEQADQGAAHARQLGQRRRMHGTI